MRTWKGAASSLYRPFTPSPPSRPDAGRRRMRKDPGQSSISRTGGGAWWRGCVRTSMEIGRGSREEVHGRAWVSVYPLADSSCGRRLTAYGSRVITRYLGLSENGTVDPSRRLVCSLRLETDPRTDHARFGGRSQAPLPPRGRDAPSCSPVPSHPGRHHTRAPFGGHHPGPGTGAQTLSPPSGSLGDLGW